MTFEQSLFERSAFEFIEASRAYGDVDGLLAGLRARIAPLGLPHVMMSNLPTGQKDVRPLVMLQGWPTDWFERYVAEEYYLHDAVTTHAANTADPFYWSEREAEIRQSPIKTRIAGEAVEFGMRHGLLVPMFAPKSWQAVVSLGGPDEIDISPREEGAILLMAHYANRQARQLVGEPQNAASLSRGEREVLLWTAAGKTAWDISVILSIPENTVIKRLASARRKMNVITTPQLIAEAYRRHEIEP